MGCYPPLAKFVSKALRKCNGRERWRKERLDYAMAYPPGLPMETHYMRPVARTVTFASNNNVYVVPQQQTPQSPPKEQPPPPPPQQEQSTPEPQQQQTTSPQHEPDHQHDTPPEQPQPEPPAQEKAEDAPPPAEPKPPKGPKRGKNKKAGRVRFGPDPPPPQEQQQQQEDEHAPDSGNGDAPPGGQGQQHGDGRRGGPAPAYLFRYTPSPLPRWEATPRRHEYFSGEYRSYYPTPVREGIYRIATDANRLTTIFSEENPNACAIV